MHIKRKAKLKFVTLNEELRRMLDERGVEWEAFDDFEQTTQWSTYNGAFVYWARERDGKLLVETTAPTKCSASCTPKQAVEITLGVTGKVSEKDSDAPLSRQDGTGTCKADKLCDGYLYHTSYWCRGCDERFAYRPIGGKDRNALPKFCPNCGRRIEVVSV